MSTMEPSNPEGSDGNVPPGPPPPPGQSSQVPQNSPPPPQGSPPGGFGAPQASYGAPDQVGGAPPVGPGAVDAHSGLVNIAGLGTAKVATLGARAIARIVDSVIYAVFWIILLVLMLAIGAAGSSTDSASLGFGGVMLIWFFGFTATVLYEFVMIAVKGQTIGKMVAGVKVVDQRNGQNPGWGASFIRILIPQIANFFCGLGLLVYLSPMFDSSGRMQGWHDNVANDLVVSTR